MSYLELLKLTAPEAVLVVTALVVLACSLGRHNRKALSSFLAAAGLLIAIASLATLPIRATLFAGMLVITPLTCLFKIVCLVLALFTILLATSETTLRHYGEYLGMILLASLGLMLLVGSEELLVIFIGLELLGLSLYVLTSFAKDDIRSAEAGLKYFLFGSTASAFTLFGISLIYGVTGTTSLSHMGQTFATAPISALAATGMIMTLVGFAFKIAAAPFHLWAPDTYQGAPISSAAFIASASKVASFVVLGKIVLVAFAPLHGSAAWHAVLPGAAPLLAVLATLSILIGNFVALVQTNVRRLLAYSAVAHAGYTLLGLVATGRDGFAATLFYTTVYGVTLIGAFGVCAVVRQQTSGDDLDDFAGVAARSPIVAGAMVIFLVSLAGLPPLAGFFGKFYLFAAAFRSGGLVWLVVIALFGSLLSLYYYLTILKAMYLPRTTVTQTLTPRPGFLQQSVLSLAAGLVLFFGLAPSFLLARIIASLA